MNLTKDTYEYILNFADDREVLHMLSVNKNFRNEKLFEMIMKRRYPLISKFKKDKSWKEFYIQTIYYLSKLKEKFQLPYIPTLDFEPESIYKTMQKPDYLPYKYISEILEIQNIGNNYHTVVYLKDDEYIIETNLIKGQSMTNLGFKDEPKDEIILDLNIEKGSEWLAFISENGSNSYSRVFQNRDKAIEYLYQKYINNVTRFVDDIWNDLTRSIPRQEIIQKDAGLSSDWQDRKKFVNKISKGIKLKMDKDIQRYDFRLVKI